jgi:hypothetical protein
MKRDMDLVRKIMLAIEKADAPLNELDIPGHDDDAIVYHVSLLNQAGLIQDAEIDFRASHSGVILTWEGHEFLDNARDNSRWKSVQKAGGKVGSFSFDILKHLLTTLAEQAAKSALGLP